MYHSLLTDATFYNSLLDLDRLIAEQIREGQCPLCSGKLNQSHFLRKPRGVPNGTHPDYPVRFSYCCAEEGCRKRFTTPSMRFLSRKVYSSVILFMIFLFNSKSDEKRVEKLNTLLNTTLSVETVRRWRHYWIKIIPQSNTWKRAAFSHELCETLPSSLLALFQYSLKEQLYKGLKWLLPLTTGIYLFDAPFRLTARE